MKKHLNKISSFLAMLVLSLSSLVGVWMPSVQAAPLVPDRVWDGGGADNDWDDVENWDENTLPVEGDIVAFPRSLAGGPFVMTNNLDVALGGLLISGTGATAYTVDTLEFVAGATIQATNETVSAPSLTVSGAITGEGALTIEADGITLNGAITTAGNLTITRTGGSSSVPLIIAGALSVTGDLVMNPYVSGNYAEKLVLNGSGAVTVSGNALAVFASGYSRNAWDIGGNLTVGDGSVTNGRTSLDLGEGSEIGGTITVKKGSSLRQLSGKTFTAGGLIVENDARATLEGTHAFPVTFGSGVSEAYPSLVANTVNYDDYDADKPFGGSKPSDLKLTGAVTLLNNLKVSVSGWSGAGVIEFAGTITYNDFTIKKAAGSTGKLIIGGKEIKLPVKTTTYDGTDEDESVTVDENETAVLKGKRFNAHVYAGGLLKGTGTLINQLSVGNGGTVAPGNSPGKMTVLQVLTMDEGSTYQAEIKNKDAYDQLVVGEQYDNPGHAVYLNNATLNVLLYPGLKINQNDTFTIIDNRSDTDVEGTFRDLPEGATFAVSDGVFKITYVGGDGNDVVLSVITIPKTPNTGFKLIMSNPYVVLTSAFSTAGAALYLTKRFSRGFAKK